MQKTIVELVDNIDGSAAAGTVKFELDGERYAIDLSEANAARLRSALKPFISAGRHLSLPEVVSRPGKPSHKAVREWAAANGIGVPARGRVSHAVVGQYLNAA